MSASQLSFIRFSTGIFLLFSEELKLFLWDPMSTDYMLSNPRRFTIAMYAVPFTRVYRWSSILHVNGCPPDVTLEEAEKFLSPLTPVQLHIKDRTLTVEVLVLKDMCAVMTRRKRLRGAFPGVTAAFIPNPRALDAWICS